MAPASAEDRVQCIASSPPTVPHSIIAASAVHVQMEPLRQNNQKRPVPEKGKDREADEQEPTSRRPCVNMKHSWYLHRNGNLISETLIPIPPRPSDYTYIEPENPRASHDPYFEPCPTGNKPNPCWEYHPEVSGITAKPTVSWWSWITFGWASPLIATGYKRDIDVNDLYLLPEQYSSIHFTPRIFHAWHRNKSLTRFRFLWAIWDAYKHLLKRMWVLKIFILMLQLSRPIILSLLLHGVTNGDETSRSLGIITILTFVSMLQALCVHHFWWYGVAVAMSSRGACIGLVYDKSLKLHSCERAVFTSGRISNLANVDCDNVRDFMWGAVHETWASPLAILLCSVMLFLLLGFSALVGVAVLIISLFVTSRLCQMLSDRQDEIMAHGDQRISLMAELVSSMKLVKLYSWESFFASKVMDVRAKQMKSIMTQAFIDSANRCLSLTIPLIVTFLTFTCFILTNGYGAILGSRTLDASTAFTSLLLFNMLKEPLGKLPECMNNAIRLMISLARLESFLITKEQELYVEKMDERTEDDVDVLIDGTFDWGQRTNLDADDEGRELAGGVSTTAAATSSISSTVAVAPSLTTSPPPPRTGPLHVISAEGDVETEEEEEEEEDEVPAVGLSLADEIRKEQKIQEKLRKKREKKNARNGEHEDERVGLTSGARDSDDLTLDLSPIDGEDESCPHHTLPGLRVRIPRGQLWMIVGSVGSGKSSLLHALLGEMSSEPIDIPQPGSGEVVVPTAVFRRTRIAYTSQISWLQSATIRENILFGLPYDEALYRQTLHVCALEPDLKRFALGDKTVVGENGLTLSGGQKARIGLARAVYAQADTYLFDEPLAAVDAHVARWLFERAIGPESILKGKTRILVTHQLQFASPAIDCIVVLKNGRIIAQGTYAEVKQQGVDLETILQQTHNLQTESAEETSDETSDETEQKVPDDSNETLPVSAMHDAALEMPSNVRGISNGKSKTHDSPLIMPANVRGISNGKSKGPILSPAPSSPDLALDSAANDTTDKDPSNPAASTDAPVQYRDEDLQQGQMSRDTYKEYFRAGAGVVGYIFVLLLVVASQTASIGSDWFLASWSTSITQAVAAAQAENVRNGVIQAPQSMHDQYSFAFTTPDPFQFHAMHTTYAYPIIQFDASGNYETATAMNATASYGDFLPHRQSWYISIYGLLVLSSGVLLLLRSVYVAFTTVTSARVLHDRLFGGIIHAPQWFFESTPSGRILNRFAKDQEQVDMVLPGCVQDILACGVIVAGTIVLIVVIAWYAVFPLAAIAALYMYVQKYYHPTSRQLKRLESITRSPIYQHLAETASGITTIRAFDYNGSLQRCMATLFDRVDTNTRVMYYAFSVHRWLGIRLEAIGSLIVFVASSLALMLSSSLGVGLVGLIISSTLSLAGNLNWTVRQVSEMENQLNSVERILEYAKIEPEVGSGAPAVGDEGGANEVYTSDPLAIVAKPSRSTSGSTVRKSSKAGNKKYTSLATASPAQADGEAQNELALTIDPPLANWPSAGEIEFSNLSLAYRPDPAFPCVLTGVSAKIRAGEKIGIVGRTGAGKSTLSLALFRLIDVRSGSISIDGVDISSVTLHELRSRLSVIPQDPLMFSSTLRDNLDPFRTTSDARLLEILELVHLRTIVESLPGKLDFIVEDGGQCFSLGERQLICLARAVVRKSKIVIMDEATSSLDFETDQLLKKFVAEQFKECTVLTIAHRLNTILDADRIMVFEAGKLVEFDTPKKLLSDAKGYLTWLVEETNSAGRIHSQPE